MLRAIYNLTTKVLIVTGEGISTFVEVIDEMSEWRTLHDTEGNSLFDVQLDFDDSIDESEDTLRNPKNYNVQYVNLILMEGSTDTYEMGNDWRNCELTIIEDIPTPRVIGVTNEYLFDTVRASFVISDDKGKELLVTKSGNRASDFSYEHIGSAILAIDDETGVTKKIK